MNYVIIIDMAAGNECAGTSWQETRIFEEDVTLKEVMEWAMTTPQTELNHSMQKITITKPHHSIKSEDLPF